KEQNRELKERDERLETGVQFLSNYLPKQFVQDLLNEDHTDIRNIPERKMLTVFFSDLKGFTNLTDQLEAEDLFQLLNKYQNLMTGIIHKYDGTLDKYLGDGLKIFFGAPHGYGTQEDALRSCLMALEMQSEMKNLRKTWFRQGIETPIDLRIGIHTGFCTVGSFGSEARMDYTAIGPAVNFASQLESECVPSKVLVSQSTWNHIHPFLQTEPHETLEVKGSDGEKSPTYLLAGIKHDIVEQTTHHALSNSLLTIIRTMPTTLTQD
ncbi:MAG: adenylate/guanylate cyclase domain-containing protein, partial [SAR324 cluster bacterium]|nr:adenylate/guanylate cyclase domain-containing protein [SAR324 cluster bacterium]